MFECSKMAYLEASVSLYRGFLKFSVVLSIHSQPRDWVYDTGEGNAIDSEVTVASYIFSCYESVILYLVLISKDLRVHDLSGGLFTRENNKLKRNRCTQRRGIKD